MFLILPLLRNKQKKKYYKTEQIFLIVNKTIFIIPTSALFFCPEEIIKHLSVYLYRPNILQEN